MKALLTTHLRFAALVACTTSIFISSPALAESPYQNQHSEEYLWMGASFAVYAAGWLALEQVKPLTTNEIATVDPSGINRFDRELMKPYHEDHAGDAMAMGSFLLPLTFLARSDMRDDAGTLGAMWFEATALSQGLAAIAKAAVRRPRPYMYDPDAPAALKGRRTARISFFSAHTTSAATNSFFMATVFSDYSSDRTAEIAMWSGAVLYSVATAIFRIESGHHFATDTIAGLAVGAAVGCLVPALHRNDDEAAPGEPESPANTFGISATFSF